MGQKGRRKIQSFGHKDRKEADPVYWITKGRKKFQTVETERPEGGRSSLLELEGWTEADPLFLTKKGRKEKYILLDLDNLIAMHKGGKASV